MFRDLDDTLKALLDDAPSATLALLDNAEKSFEQPGKDFPPMNSQLVLNLFLYDVHENRELRDPVPITERAGNTYVRRRPPLRVDCSYMVTAWSKPTNPGDKVQEEHRLLSQALQWLSRFPIIPAGYLKGGLKNPPFPHRTEVALPNGGKSMGEFWTALSQPPRPSFNLVVTLALDLKSSIEGDLVTTKITGYQQTGKPESAEMLITIGGRVLTNATTPQAIANAWVMIDDFATTRTDAEGRFIVDNLSAGAHTLRAIATGFKPGTKAITIPGLAAEYEIKLDPL